MQETEQFQPLAARMRPRTISEYVGQQHLLGEGKPIFQAMQQQKLHSMILWGPPGTGKTTLAMCFAKHFSARFEKLSAVFAGVKDVREAVARAQDARLHTKQTILFIDEVHRFNKAQQDAFLPYVEDGTISLIGATTENPSFELNNALLSRARVYVLKPLAIADIKQIITTTLADKERGLGAYTIDFPEDLQTKLAQAADGDARYCLNLLEIIVAYCQSEDNQITITGEILAEIMQEGHRRFDKKGDDFYDQISALHKAVRGSSPDAALYWFCRMIDGGCDPLYIARRMVRMASEDIGNADPRALEMTLNAWDTYSRLGSPEGELTLAQTIIYLACAAKSNATYNAYKAAMKDVKEYGSLPVPLHIRNAPTKLMKSLDYGKDYRYAHNEAEAYAVGENYFPEGLEEAVYYHPVERGLEIKIKQKLDYLKSLDKAKT